MRSKTGSGISASSAAYVPVILDVTAQQTLIILFIAGNLGWGRGVKTLIFYLETHKNENKILKVNWLMK